MAESEFLYKEKKHEDYRGTNAKERTDLELWKKFYVSFALKEVLKQYRFEMRRNISEQRQSDLKSKIDYLLDELINDPPPNFVLPEIVYTLLRLYPEIFESDRIPDSWKWSIVLDQSQPLEFEYKINPLVREFYTETSPMVAFYPNEAKLKVWAESSSFYIMNN